MLPYLDSDKARFPQSVVPPKGAPNVVLILLDDAGFGQFGTFGGGIPSPAMDQGQVGFPNEASPRVLNKSWTITADVEVPEKGDGMIVTQGGLTGGYGLYLRQGKPVFVYNFLGVDRPTFAGDEPLPRGHVNLVVGFIYVGMPGEVGKGGKLTLSANGKVVARGRLERTIPIQIGLGEGLDIGMDVGSAVDFTYKLPFAFTGTIQPVTVDLK